MPNEVTIQKLAEAINKSWRKTTESVLETARLCAEADRKLETNEKKKLVEDLDFNDSTFSKLVTIGSRPQLQTDPVKSPSPAQLLGCLSAGDANRSGGGEGDQGRCC